MELTKLVSIIIPVYNAEKYLSKTLNSIINQTYQNIEVILIDDGSEDSSGSICDGYASKDKRIKVIHQKNAGPSLARNIGIQNAIGEYIQFIDCDDYIDSHMTEKLINSVKQNTDLIICGYNVVMNEQKIVQVKTPSMEGNFTIEDFITSFGHIYQEGFFIPLWNKLYSKNIIFNKKIRFNENINIGEDLLFNLEYLKWSNNITVMKDNLYYYNFLLNTDSLSSSYKKNFFENQKMLYDEVVLFLKENKGYYGLTKESVDTIFIDGIISSLNNLFHINSGLTVLQKKKEIEKIILDQTIRQLLNYFNEGSFQKRFIGSMIKSKNVTIIYRYFYLKELVRGNLSGVFKLLKKLNK